MIHDGVGLYGSLLVHFMLIALFGSTLLVFLFLWRRDRLDMGESPKFQVFNQEEE